MAKFSSKATINLEVNGQQAKKMLNDLQKNAADLTEKIRKAADAGDKVSMKKWQKELNEVNRLISQLTTESQSVANVMARLDRATPKELNKTLSTLRRQLNNIERGSEAWNKHTAMIRQVRAELDRVNSTLQVAESRWSRMNRWLNDCQTFLLGATAALTGFVMSARRAVDAFASLDQEMANVRKYTGMSADEVTALNEELKKINTRSPREELNKLAQQAGRLGKTSQEDVLGFVKAADKINVALDEMGEDATLTLSKLTGIFGDEKRLGTEKSLLAVGSVVNELSQNCSAAAPYITEFASRMGGVGAQAKMTVPQIMAFAAVLDSNNQKLEASSTALSQVIVRIYQDPAKYAKVAGINVRKFSNLVRYDMNSALLLFLETLDKAGNMDVLSPMFKDMGENGSRAIAALSTLANNIAAVKSQQDEANKALREAVSIDKEFEVQNNTVQASLEKAKNKFNELAAELGGNLYPVMRYVYTSSSMFLRVLNQIITFVLNNRTELVALTAAIVAYSVAVNAASLKIKALSAYLSIQNAALYAHRIAVLAECSALNLLKGNLSMARAAFMRMTTAMLANPFGAAAAAAALLVVAIVRLTKHTETYLEKAGKIAKNSLEISEASLKEQRDLEILIGTLKGAKAGTEEYESAKKSIISQYGRYLSGLIDEKGEIINLSAAYDTLSRSIERSNRMRGINAAKEELDRQYFEEQTQGLKHLQSALEGYGASAMEASSIVAKVAQAISAGRGVDPETAALINKYSEGMSARDTRTGKEWDNKAQQWFASIGLSFGEMVTPASIYNALQNTRKDNDKARENIEQLELGINPTKNYKNRELLESRNELVELIKNNVYDVANIPNFYVDDEKSAAPYVLNEQGQRWWAASQQHNKVSVGMKNASPWEPLAVDKPKSGLVEAGKIGETVPQASIHQIVIPDKPRDKFSGTGYTRVSLSPAEAKQILAQIEDELRLRGVSFGDTKNADGDDDKPDRYSSRLDADKASRAAEIKQRKDFKKALEKVKAQMNRSLSFIKMQRALGKLDYREYADEEFKINQKYYSGASYVYKKFGLADKDDEDYQELLNKRRDMEKKFNDQKVTWNIEAAKRMADIQEQEIRAEYAMKKNRSLADEIQMQEEILKIKMDYLEREKSLYTPGSKEFEDVSLKIHDLAREDVLEKEKMLRNQIYEFQNRFDKMSVKEKYEMEREALKELYKRKYITEEQYRKWLEGLENDEKNEEKKKDIPGETRANKNREFDSPSGKIMNAGKNLGADINKLNEALQRGDITLEEYEKRLKNLGSDWAHNFISAIGSVENEWVRMFAKISDSWLSFADVMLDKDSETWDKIAAGASAAAATVAAVTSQITAFQEAELQIQLKNVEKRYDREISFAEGNSYLTRKLEKEKEEEIAKAKEQAMQKNFAMQVLAAVAQTAANAIAAYGSVASIPVVGPTLGAAAAAMAVAAGMIQVATIKKQQQQAAATGYSEGGFTEPGPKDKPAGVVHAGEWVASQKLVNSPRTRPLIDALEYAQRNNTIGSISMADVSRSVAAPMMLAYSGNQQPQTVNVQLPDNSGDNPVVLKLEQTVNRLNERLDEPFITHNTVTGPYGSKAAEDKYKKLMSNKSRRKRG